MEIFELPFVKIIKLDDDIAEVIVNDGIEYTMDMVNQYHEWIRKNMQCPCYILVNRINNYAYTFEAQQQLATIPEIAAIAHLVYSYASEVATTVISEMPKAKPWNAKTFTNREDALQWLETQRST